MLWQRLVGISQSRDTLISMLDKGGIKHATRSCSVVNPWNHPFTTPFPVSLISVSLLHRFLSNNVPFFFFFSRFYLIFVLLFFLSDCLQIFFLHFTYKIFRFLMTKREWIFYEKIKWILVFSKIFNFNLLKSKNIQTT